jgi:hypothetical protein
MVVDDGERMAPGARGQPDLALEIHLPKQVRRFTFEAGWRQMVLRVRADPVVARKDRMHSRGARRRDAEVEQPPGDLARAPGRMFVAN